VPPLLERSRDAETRREVPASIPTCPGDACHASCPFVVDEDASDETLDDGFRAPAVETEIPAEQLPDVDVGRGDERERDATALGATRASELLREHGVDPRPVVLATPLGHVVQAADVMLLREQ